MLIHSVTGLLIISPALLCILRAALLLIVGAALPAVLSDRSTLLAVAGATLLLVGGAAILGNNQLKDTEANDRRYRKQTKKDTLNTLSEDTPNTLTEVRRLTKHPDRNQKIHKTPCKFGWKTPIRRKWYCMNPIPPCRGRRKRIYTLHFLPVDTSIGRK